MHGHYGLLPMMVEQAANKLRHYFKISQMFEIGSITAAKIL